MQEFQQSTSVEDSTLFGIDAMFVQFLQYLRTGVGAERGGRQATAPIFLLVLNGESIQETQP